MVSPGRSAPAPATPAPPLDRTLIDKYCISCHNQRLKTGGLTLDAVNMSRVDSDAETWEKVIRKLRAGMMPPAGRPRPDKATADRFVAGLEAHIDRAAAVDPNPGRPAIHRLNRAEYANAVRDLLALEIDGPSLLPADSSGYGFDNIADVLTLSPALHERYLLAARQISRLAVGDPTIRPSTESYRLPYLVLVQNDRMDEDLPFGTRGGAAIRHYFPVDGEYVLSFRLQKNSLLSGGEIRGINEENEIDVRLDGMRLRLFRVGGKSESDKEDSASGPYATQQTIDRQRKVEEGLEVRFPAKAGQRVIGITFQERTPALEGPGPSRLPVAGSGYAAAKSTTIAGGKVEMSLDSVHITGPFNARTPEDTPSRRRIFVCRPARPDLEESCAKTILSTLARRAYRRPVTREDVQVLLDFYKAGRSSRGFESGIERALDRMLVDPDFLLRIERDPPNVASGAAYRINDLELASRLSFFLWSSIPDEPLLQLAERGRLREPAVLEQQVRRMLADSRSKALATNFFGQWLWLRNVATVKPDPKIFPEFDENLRRAFHRETELFLESQLREDRSVLDLLTANYTFVNERLARHYGIPAVYGNRFRRVTYSDDARGGLLGHGSVLTVTSYANRTSPVIRGKWMLENLLGAPPPAPPPDVPDLKENGENGQPLSVRERLQEHRKNPTCASCHAQMDPLGFALENFDGIGRWRTTDARTPVDASGVLADGTTFNGPREFRELLRSRRDEFITTVIERLLTYALGRGAEYYDRPAIRTILRDTASDDHWSAIVLGVVKSAPFQMRKGQTR